MLAGIDSTLSEVDDRQIDASDKSGEARIVTQAVQCAGGNSQWVRLIIATYHAHSRALEWRTALALPINAVETARLLLRVPVPPSMATPHIYVIARP
jgi:hypothetical protein